MALASDLDLTVVSGRQERGSTAGRDEGSHMDQARPARRYAFRPSSSVLRVRAFLALLALDCSVIFGCMAGVAALRAGFLFGQPALVFAAALLPVYVVIASNLGAYSSANFEHPSHAVQRAEQALALAIATLILAGFYLKSSESFPRLTIAIGTGGAALALAVTRYLFVRNLASIIGGNPFSAILIRDGEEPIPSGQFSMVATAHSLFDPDEHDPVMYDRLAKSLKSYDRVVIACSPERRGAWARALRGANIQGEIAIPELAELAPLGLGPHREAPAVIVASGPLSLGDRCVKRLFDVASASTALICAAPLMVAVALWIKLDSPGPVLFRQVRIGRGNQMFQVFKFRSMRVVQSDAAGNRSASRDDDRVTRCGRVIRKTSIDELPQLLNVLLGQMSIVGPRPHALGSRAADKLFWEVDQRYWNRHAAKPGLTGLAQVRGFRGATLVEDDLTNRLKADLEYLERWSIWRDLKIILQTAGVVLHRNAF